MNARIKWVEDVMFVGESGSGHGLIIDGAPDGGGRNAGMRPMELIALGTGGCSAFDVMTILRKARQKVTGCEARVSARRAEGVPAVFTSLHVRFIIAGDRLSEEQVRRAVELSAEKYCSASIMLKRAGVAVTHDFEIVPA